MRVTLVGASFPLVLLTGLAGTRATAATLSFEDRVRAQEAIERVYYSHQTGATKSFETAVPADLLRRKVRAYLNRTMALESVWRTPITSGMLLAEWERMARGTRMPDRLAELQAALGHDPLLIQECLVRPALVNRLTESFFAYDPSIHAEARRRAEAISRRGILPGQDPGPDWRIDLLILEDSSHRTRALDPREPATTLGTAEFDAERSRLPAGIGQVGMPSEEKDAIYLRTLLEETPDSLKVATLRVPKVTWEEWWARVEADRRDGLQSFDVPAAPPIMAQPPVTAQAHACALPDSWGADLVGGPPGAREGHAALWTGSAMIIWGCGAGYCGNAAYLYDPATDTWSTGSAIGAPRVMSAPNVWTGGFMVIWGGGGTNESGRYDPIADRWLPISQVGAPSVGSGRTAVSTGTEMIVWGGLAPSGDWLRDGGRYDPRMDVWSPLATANAPEGRAGPTAVWTGTEMIIWGGFIFDSSGHFQYFNTGGRYDPIADAWSPWDPLESTCRHASLSIL